MSQEFRETIILNFSEIEYRLLIREKILWKVPTRMGEWLYKHGLAVQEFTNVSILEEEIDI